MYNEEQYIYNAFMKNFIQNKKGNIVLYGTGVHTGKLLEKIDKQQIKGLMDVKKIGEILWGYRILSYEEVKEIPDACIVIIARDAVIHTVYRRIESFCKENNISVYDINGNNLKSKQISVENQSCFLLRREDLIKKIEKAEYITFDIFDTLLTRKILSPQDVFLHIDNLNSVSRLRFSEERKRAEERAWVAKNPTIHDIYNCLQKSTGISDSEKESLLKLEVEVENSMLCRRESMCRVLDYAINCGKKVYLISDMYLTKEIIERILWNHQITEYDGLFVSCEYSTGKQERLFQVAKKVICQDRSGKLLHIGDNFFSDIYAARKAGYDTYQIFSPREMYERSIYSAILPEPENLEEELILGKFVSELYNDPFGLYKGNGKIILNNASRITELLIAPIILKYIIFLIQTVIEKKIDFVIFPSRDGFLLQRIYNIARKKMQLNMKLPESVYFYTSRRAALLASAYTEQDIRSILSISDSRNFRDILKARFGIRLEKGFQINDKKLSSEMLESMYKICKEERKNYQKYIVSSGISDHQFPAFVDFIAVGTIQAALEKLTGKKMHGIYFLKRRSSEKQYEELCVDSLYGSAGDFNVDANIYRYYYFLENILSSEEPSLMSMAEDGKPCFYNEERTRKDVELLCEIHKSVEDYVQDMIHFLPDILNCTANVRMYDAILGLLSKDYSEFDEEEIFCMKNVDEFMGRTVTSINR